MFAVRSTCLGSRVRLRCLITRCPSGEVGWRSIVEAVVVTMQTQILKRLLCCILAVLAFIRKS